MKAMCPMCGEVSQTRYQCHLHIATSHEHDDTVVTPGIAEALLVSGEFVTYGSDGFVKCVGAIYNTPGAIGNN